MFALAIQDAWAALSTLEPGVQIAALLLFGFEIAAVITVRSLASREHAATVPAHEPAPTFRKAA